MQNNLLWVILGTALLFVLLHFFVVPRAASKVVKTDAGKEPKRAVVATAGFATLDAIRSISLLAFISAAVTGAFLVLIDLQGGTDVGTLGAVLEKLRGWRNGIGQFSSQFGILASVILVIGLVISARLAGKRKIQSALYRAREIELERLKAQRENGEWEYMEPTPEIAELQARLDERKETLEAVEEALSQASEDEEREAIRPVIGLIRIDMEADGAEIERLETERRLFPKPDPNEIALPAPRNLWERIQTFFISRGITSCFSSVGRLLFIVAMLLLIPSLLTIASGPVNAALTTKIYALEDTYLGLKQQDAEAAWAETAGVAAKEEQALTAEDEAVLDEIASAYEQSVIQYNARLAQVSVRAANSALTRNLVRRAVLQSTASRTAGSAAPAVVRGGKAVALSEADRAALHLQEQALLQRGPVTAEGQRFRANLGAEARRKPGVLAMVREKASTGLHSFQVPAQRAQLRVMALTNLTGLGGDLALPEGHAFSEMAKGMDEMVEQQARKRARSIQSRRFLNRLAQPGATVQQAYAEVAHAPLQHAPWTEPEVAHMKTMTQRLSADDGIARAYRDHPPSIARLTEPRVDMARASKVAQRISNTHLGGNPGVNFGDALASFDDFMPGQPDAPRHSERGKLRNKIDRPRPASNSANRAAAKRSYKMARSYTRLRGFSRIGGVLIGRAPEDPVQPLDFTGFSWTLNSGGVRLTLTRNDGKTFELAPFRPNIVHLALSYASDGRPVTVTMVTAHPLLDLKILLHPALVDSALGCRVIELDRYVDRFAGGDASQAGKQRSSALRSVYAQDALYQVAWAVRIKNGIENSLLVGATELAEALDKRADSILKDGERLSLAASALTDTDWVGDPDRSPLLVKDEFYDPALVKLIAKCAPQSNEGLEGFAQCIGQRAKTSSSSFQWTALPPEWVEWSGVREYRYHLDPDLAFLIRSGTNEASENWPFVFMNQVAFTSPAYMKSGPDGVWWNSDEALEYTDAAPWEFPLVKPLIGPAVRQAVDESPVERRDMARLREFVLLQRLFRNALDGNLGEDFPIDVLPALAQETAPFVNAKVQTPRWTSKPGRLEGALMRQIEQALQALTGADGMDPAARRCLSELDSISSIELSKMEQSTWLDVCDLTGFSAEVDAIESAESRVTARKLLQTSAYVNDVRELRLSLGVVNDEERLMLVASNDACGD